MYRIFGRDKILRGVLVLLITAVMLLSTVAVAENTSISAQLTNIGKSEPDVGIFGDVLLEEGFEDGVMPPSGWSLEVSNPDYTWEIVDAASEPDLVHSGDYAAVVRWCPYTYQDELLISPEVDLTDDWDSVHLSFWFKCIGIPITSTVRVWIFGDGFDDKIWDSSDIILPDPHYTEVDIDISEYIGNTITLRWHYDGFGAVCDFALDDINIYGTPPPPPELEIGNITGGIGKICAEIKNVGEGDANDVNWSINMTSPLLPTWWKEWHGTIPNLPAGETEIVCTDGFILGFGKVWIGVTASAPDAETVEKKADGFVLFFFIIILP